jgi:threonine dehydratase
MKTKNIPSHQTVEDVLPRIKKYIHRTPVLTSSLINEIACARLFFKCENFQKGGAYKIRGAMNAILQLTSGERDRGVVTHSSGNFAQALSLAGASTDTKTYIVMPENAPAVKKAAVRDYGGIIIESASTPQAREAKAEEVIKQTGATFIHPSNDMQVILGQSTAARELIEECNPLDAIIAPVGGGGVIAGTSLSVRSFSPTTIVYGAEPSGADDAYRSLQAGKIFPSTNPDTICDGLRTNLGDQNFPIIQAMVKEIIRVEDVLTVFAMHLVMERMKIIIEPSSAITLAAVLKEKERFRNQRIGLIITGGNVDLRNLSTLLSKASH